MSILIYSAGFIQLVEAIPLSETKQHGSIQNYLRQIGPDTSDPSGINNEVLETYILSCGEFALVWN